jgi:hypothetical protein
MSKIEKVEAYTLNGNKWDVTTNKDRLVNASRENVLSKFTTVSCPDRDGSSNAYWYGEHMKGFGKKKRVAAYKDGYKEAYSNGFYRGAQEVREKIITFYPELSAALAKVDEQAKEIG